MAKITIDEVEYDLDDFTEEQNNLLNEITFNGNIQTQLNYQLQGLRSRSESLVAALNSSLKTEEE